MRIDLGFELRNVLSVDVSPRRGATPADVARLSQTVTAVVATVRRVPGIEWAALVSGTPPLVLGDDSRTITVPGRPPFTDPGRSAGRQTRHGRLLPGAPRGDSPRADVHRGGRRSRGAAGRAAQRIWPRRAISRGHWLGAPSKSPARPARGQSSAWSDPYGCRVPRASCGLKSTRRSIRQDLRGNPILTLVMRTTADAAALGPAVRAAVHGAAPDLPAPLQQYKRSSSARSSPSASST